MTSNRPVTRADKNHQLDDWLFLTSDCEFETGLQSPAERIEHRRRMEGASSIREVLKLHHIVSPLLLQCSSRERRRQSIIDLAIKQTILVSQKRQRETSI